MESRQELEAGSLYQMETEGVDLEPDEGGAIKIAPWTSTGASRPHKNLREWCKRQVLESSHRRSKEAGALYTHCGRRVPSALGSVAQPARAVEGLGTVIWVRSHGCEQAQCPLLQGVILLHRPCSDNRQP